MVYLLYVTFYRGVLIFCRLHPVHLRLLLLLPSPPSQKYHSHSHHSRKYRSHQVIVICGAEEALLLILPRLFPSGSSPSWWHRIVICNPRGLLLLLSLISYTHIAHAHITPLVSLTCISHTNITHAYIPHIQITHIGASLPFLY